MGEESIEHNILECEHRVWKAVIDKDRAELSALFAEDYSEITFDGKRVDGQSVIEHSPIVDEIRHYSIDQEQCVSLSENSVLLSYHLYLEGDLGGVPILPRDRWATSIWKQTNGSWQCAFFQQSAYLNPAKGSISQKAVAKKDQSHPFEIVPLGMTHVAQVLELWDRAEGVVVTFSDTPEELSRYFQDNPGMSQAAVVPDGRVVGAILCGHDGRRGYLHHLAVDSQFQNMGIGRELVNSCEAALLHAGVQQCNLFVLGENSDAQKFWEKLGWIEWPNLKFLYKRLHPVVGTL